MNFFIFNDESKDDSIERLAEYYANGEMSEKDFKKAMKQIKHSNFNTVVDECNSHRLSKQTLEAQEKMRSGGRATGYAPIGYRNIRHWNGEFDVVPDYNVASKIATLFSLCEARTSIDYIVKAAKSLGLVGKKSKKPLTKQAIIYILNNPFYCGFVRGRKHPMYRHKYESIISEKQFLNCLYILEEQGYITIEHKKDGEAA